MRKYLALLLAAALSLTLAACGGSAQQPNAPDDGGESAEPEVTETAAPETDALTRQTQYGPVQGTSENGAEMRFSAASAANRNAWS